MANSTASPLLRLLTPLLRTIPSRQSVHLASTTLPSSKSAFSSSARSLAAPSQGRGGGGGYGGGGGGGGSGSGGHQVKRDSRITLIRYHLQHPRNPRPLRLSRLRSLRHWTIHRAWMMFRRKKELAQELELERMHRSMYNACEALRLLDGPGNANGGRLYRVAMEKKGIFRPGGVPIEYARHQTETPGREVWNHGWTR